MWKTVFLWILAIILTVASAYYQRLTGPTYPIEESKTLGTTSFTYKLERSHSTSSDYLVTIPTNNPTLEGILSWKRFKTNDDWNVVKMEYVAGNLTGVLPKQPSAGKLEYRVRLTYNNKELALNNGESIVIRFKGDVPAWILIPHIITIFLAMLFSLRTGFEAFRKNSRLKNKTAVTFVTLVIGGLIFGPLTQLYAFGALWTGFPFGYDLTDNKTLIAFVFWLFALIAVIREKKERLFVGIAAVVTLVIFLIPHSLLGSELDYNKHDRENNRIENIETK
ncbi:MAG: hypothetical protein GX452_00765 [Ignavibacteriales bacterium]|nr:hypothetical protein [Ignavibacteriales bacterium]HOJ18461.1 hypothetical protein [Ignavibacteriaceae bacterium]HPO56155.1 hypothetical protein [Ignavibacteriaceae bacterium]